jgi:predicted RNA-binding protein (virulence factor B family)
MLAMGQFNSLQIVEESEVGFFLDSGDEHWGNILLPFKTAPKNCDVGDWLEVFIHFDSEDRIIATCQRPHALVGEFQLMRVVAVEKVGAFLDWGLPKDLLCPFGEQKIRLEKGRSYVVHVYVDDQTGRIVASTRLDRFLNDEPCFYEVGQAVELIITRETELGYNAIINNCDRGVLYHNEVFRKLRVGLKLRGFVGKVRPDGKIDLALNPPGYDKVGGIAQKIMSELRRNNGFLAVTSKTPAEEISRLFGVSKKSYKMALGSLYKKRLVAIEEGGIRLLDGRPGQ